MTEEEVSRLAQEYEKERAIFDPVSAKFREQQKNFAKAVELKGRYSTLEREAQELMAALQEMTDAAVPYRDAWNKLDDAIRKLDEENRRSRKF